MNCTTRVMMIALAIFATAAAVGATAQSTGRNQMTVEVDVAPCVEAYSFCTELGTAGVPAAVGNHGPVLLMIQAIGRDGVPITGLADTAFSILHKVSPQGSGPTKATCASCFVDHGDGVYSLVVHRTAAANPWLDGIYYTQLSVTIDPQRIFRALVPIEIP